MDEQREVPAFVGIFSPSICGPNEDDEEQDIDPPHHDVCIDGRKYRRMFYWYYGTEIPENSSSQHRTASEQHHNSTEQHHNNIIIKICRTNLTATKQC